MRAALLLSALVGAGIVACPQAAAADVPGYADLPSGHATAPPESTPPALIPAHEKVPGFLVATPGSPRRFKGPSKPGAKPVSGPSYVLVVGTPEQVKRVESGMFGGTRTDDAAAACFSQSRDFGRLRHERARADDESDEDDDAAGSPLPDWSEGLSSTATVNLKTEHDPTAGVTAVHSERYVSDASGPRIEMIDAWVDPVTKGVRKIASATLPLKRMGSARGLEVYAARDEREKKRAVQFVVVPSKDTPNETSDALIAVTGDGRTLTSSSCTHLRFALRAGDRDADSAVLRTTLRLPDRDDGKRTDEDGEKRARMREAAVQLGVSKTMRDPQPVISLTFGWAGRETSQIVRSDE